MSKKKKKKMFRPKRKEPSKAVPTPKKVGVFDWLKRILGGKK